MLAQNISKRYQTAEAVLNDLNSLDTSQVTSSPIVTPQPPVKKQVAKTFVPSSSSEKQVAKTFVPSSSSEKPIAKTFVPSSPQIQTPQPKPDPLEMISILTMKVRLMMAVLG